MSNTVNVNFSEEDKNLRVRFVYNDGLNNNWLSSRNLTDFKSIDIYNKKTTVIFEFQDTRDVKTYKSKEYILWKYDDVYSDYIDKLNSNLNFEPLPY